MPEIPDSDAIGPVDVALVLFEGSQFNGEVAPALVDLQDSGAVRIIDLALLSKTPEGDTLVVEVEDADVADAFAVLSDGALDLLNDEDLAAMADALDPGSSALAVAWENTWARRLAAAVRGSGGELVAQYRIPHDVVVAALDALREELEDLEDELEDELEELEELQELEDELEELQELEDEIDDEDDVLDDEEEAVDEVVADVEADVEADEGR
jgi:hypothetical protein